MTDRVDIDRLTESAYQFRDPQFHEETLEERYKREGEKLAKQVMRELKRKFVEALSAEMSKVYFDDYATTYLAEQKDNFFDELEEELMSWTK